MIRNLLSLLIALAIFSPSKASAADFATWLANFRLEAAQQGISQRTIQAALSDVQIVQKAIELDRKQPEKKITFAQYKKNIVNAQRINKGRQLLTDNYQSLKWVEQTFGVAPQYVIALWGIETNFGSNTGGFKVVDALATLAWEGRRAEFFKGELLKALRIIDEGHITAQAMKGSWAGAMGQNQFMPSSFLNFAVDADGDGHKDIWNTRLDVFASTANYLSKNGWKAGERWGRRIRLPQGFQTSLIESKTEKTLAQWNALGVRELSGAPLPSENMSAYVVTPDGIDGEAYLAYNNYRTIMSWNRSTYFATSVGLLADAIASR